MRVACDDVRGARPSSERPPLQQGAGKGGTPAQNIGAHRGGVNDTFPREFLYMKWWSLRL
jgi:hypothetical protein